MKFSKQIETGRKLLNGDRTDFLKAVYCLKKGLELKNESEIDIHVLGKINQIIGFIRSGVRLQEIVENLELELEIEQQKNIDDHQINS